MALLRDVDVAEERDGRVVHQHVEPSEVLQRGPNHAHDVFLAGEIGWHREPGAPDGLDVSDRLVDRPRKANRRRVGGARRACHGAALPRQRHRDGPADPPRRAGHQRHLPGQFHQIASRA